MSLSWLNLCRTKITDLSPLGKLPLSHLDLHRTRMIDLLPLKDVPLRSLDIHLDAPFGNVSGIFAYLGLKYY